jgi:hypothetical protein
VQKLGSEGRLYEELSGPSLHQLSEVLRRPPLRGLGAELQPRHLAADSHRIVQRLYVYPQDNPLACRRAGPC